MNYPLNEVYEFVGLLPRRNNEFIDMMKAHYFWKLYHSTESGVDKSTWNLFEEYLAFFPNAPASASHSKVLGLAERVMKENNAWRFYDFFRRWNPAKLRDVDWKEEKGDNGAAYKPLAIKSLKKAHEAIKTLPNESIGDIQWLIDLYSIAVARFPDDDWNIRSKALLHLRVGQLAKARSIYKDLCLKMGEKYYIWSEFANCWNETSVKIAFLCKAISLEKDEKFIGKIRLELAQQLIKAEKYENAAAELEQYKTYYTKMGWRINAEFDTLLGQCSSVAPAKDKNAALYEENIPIAEECAYADIAYTEVVLVNKWKNDAGKVMMAFVSGDTIEFTTNKKRFPALRNSHDGQVWKFKLYKIETVKTIPSVYPSLRPKTETIIKYIPLIAAPSEAADWSTLPIKYGHVQYVNTKKKVYHIYSADSKLVYEHFEEQILRKGDFVTFRQYTKKIKEERRVFIKDIRRCDELECIAQFKCGIAVVDNVNVQKQLFHFILDPKTPGILHYEETELRPAIGDFIKIYYYVRTIEEKKHPGQEKKVVEVLKAELTDEINSNLVKDIEGTLEVKYKNHDDGEGEDDREDDEKPDYAFIDGHYVHKTILRRYNILYDCHVRAKAIYSGSDKWRVYEISTE